MFFAEMTKLWVSDATRQVQQVGHWGTPSRPEKPAELVTRGMKTCVFSTSITSIVLYT